MSVVASSNGRGIEAGLVGREGMTGVALIMDDYRSPDDVFVQAPGAAQRIAAGDLRAAIAASGTLHRLLLRYARAFMVQITQTALANGRAKLEQRLARWLLMARDRLDARAMPLTHEFLALMLCVQRPGVTVALQEMEGKGLIRLKRGAVSIADGAGLKRLAGAYSGVPERECARLIGHLLDKKGSTPS
ncbi:MAG: Crp/Fnr family transcriptional regulator [Hyphomonadaceae bacterium JAD_PAG50586_4]|nr:MAG: Crp/Fnr family transcriptional regulator [Hyphomonadaceae bacterium JAD_PAG50586_4]